MVNESFVTKVDGMICPQCEDEIAHRLLHTRGARSDAIALAAVICLYFMIPAVTGLVKVPAAESGAGVGALFIIGVLTGVHCIGMCGGIMLSQRSALLYNGGRLLSYTVMGALFGTIGRIFSYDAELKSMLFTVFGLLVVLIGLRMWGVPILRRLSPVPAKLCRFKGKALAVGLLTGLMPCGALSSMWIFAASSGSWKSGTAAMLAFGLGTCVFMLAFGLFGVFIPKKYNKILVKCSTVLIVAVGLILMTKGIKILL